MLRKRIHFCPLPLETLRLHGPDTERYLQNQLTVDLRDLTKTRTLLGGICAPNGRLVATFRLVRGEDFVRFIVPTSVAPLLAERLLAYRLRSRFEVERETDRGAPIGLIGVEFEAGRLGGLHVPQDTLGAAWTGATVALRVSSSRVLLLPDPGERAALLETLSALTTPGGETAWRLEDIRDGLPTIVAETSQAFVPQMVNLDLVGGVSFTKGCYPGQEVVARLRYLGELKRRMVRARVASDTAAAPGDAVYGDSEGSRTVVGKVIDGAAVPEAGAELLVVVQLAHVRSGSGLSVSSPAGSELEILPLPYAVDLGSGVDDPGSPD